MTNPPVDLAVRPRGRTTLSHRESEIVDQATQGLTDKEIALELGIRFTSVKSHWARIRRKLNASNRAQVIAMQVRKNLETAERVATEQTGEFQRLRAYWSTLLMHVPLFITVVDEHGRYQWCGHRDYPGLADGIVGRHHLEVVSTEDRNRVKQNFDRVISAGESVELTLTFLAGDRLFGYVGYSHPVREGDRTIGAISVGQVRPIEDIPGYRELIKA